MPAPTGPAREATAAGNVLIQKYIGSKQYFGLAVNPSSEGLRYPIDNGLLDQNQFPVIGADGMLIDQYQDGWVWPIATSQTSCGCASAPVEPVTAPPRKATASARETLLA